MATVEDVVGLYIKLRDKKAVIEAETKERTKQINEQLVKLEAWIQQQADAQKVTSFKTKHGTAFLTTTDFASVADWDAMLDYVKRNNAYDLLEKRVSKTAVRGYIAADGNVPAGITYGTRIDVNVRKPAAKVED